MQEAKPLFTQFNTLPSSRVPLRIFPPLSIYLHRSRRWTICSITTGKSSGNSFLFCSQEHQKGSNLPLSPPLSHTEVSIAIAQICTCHLLKWVPWTWDYSIYLSYLLCSLFLCCCSSQGPDGRMCRHFWAGIQHGKSGSASSELQLGIQYTQAKKPHKY